MADDTAMILRRSACDYLGGRLANLIGFKHVTKRHLTVSSEFDSRRFMWRREQHAPTYDRDAIRR